MTSLTPLRDATDIAAHGGKAVQLARLITAGLPIPAGSSPPATSGLTSFPQLSTPSWHGQSTPRTRTG
jgi:hypothetical protein